MESAPRELSLAEIRSFMLKNNCKVTNHALVKHFRLFLTNKETQEESRKLFKSYVNILASIKNEGEEKYLILRKKYVTECPTDDLSLNVSSRSFAAPLSDNESSPFKQPPPYRPPPEVPDQCSPRGSVALSRKNSSDTGPSGSEFSFGSEVMSVESRKIGSVLVRSASNDSPKSGELSRNSSLNEQNEAPPAIPPRKRVSVDQSYSRQVSIEEKIPEAVKNVPVGSIDMERDYDKENVLSAVMDKNTSEFTDKTEPQEENKLSVKEKMLKFNRFASEEEAKIPSPIGKKKPEKGLDDTISTENLPQHPKAKEWLIAAANANYHELAKLSTDHPNLVKLQNPQTLTAVRHK
ncbi:uncharacterized protein LOC129771019 isoform X2 [Toxorhynchites rutilus septentrionalis]|uniref:uncharacterized protein LOC129771019 isoform X2 n=1 Tax=Toxorhynchites rutilus septentrionalis TaxID=329112 RepID=UPI00247A48C5|nr:uncharacterized protein LOC129771019 isoform X2 [Toxorhynchites rutilus septentrionalis]